MRFSKLSDSNNKHIKDYIMALHSAAISGDLENARKLLQSGKYDVNMKADGHTALHLACFNGHIDMVRMLISEFKADVNIRVSIGNTPLHYAARNGNEDIVLALIHEFSCDVNIRGYNSRKFLHEACVYGHANIVKSAGMHISPIVIDKNGNTPLHIASYKGHRECAEAMLQLNAPIMLRNAKGETSRDIAQWDIKPLLETYLRDNRNTKLYVRYDALQVHAKKKYSTAEHITRVFVVGNPGAGKSSFVETMKKEGFFESFGKVSESSVPLHTTGIVPSIYISKRYGRVMFYDFAGDPEYYSSHAAILENIASSSKGDNIFIIVVDLREDNTKIRNNLHYWFSFIQYQKSDTNNIIFIGSHSDVMVKEDIEEREKVFECFFENAYGASHEKEVFKLDCCKPKSKELKMIQDKIVDLTRNSPRYSLSLYASTLLGLLEMDFGNVTACSVQTILDHINEIGIALPKNITSLLPVLQQLHDIGILFMTGGDKCDNLQVILNISKLTNEVHKLLFAKDAKLKLIKRAENKDIISTFNIGVLPEAFLDQILHQYITKECLVQLQYCQVISHKDVGTFLSLPQSGSSDQSFLFFPALCSAEKSDVAWTTPPGLSYSIGWLARCSDTSCDHFPSRFLHVLLLRLIFKFTLQLQVPSQSQTPSDSSPDHYHLTRCCSMWNLGVHWWMENGVECTVEMADSRKEMTVITKSKEEHLENCMTVFNSIVSCVMEAKAQFCHSITPQFFLLDPTTSADPKDNLFSLSAVERVLNEGKEVVLSCRADKPPLYRSKFSFLRNFIIWNDIFPLDSTSVLHSLQEVVRRLYQLGLYLGVPASSVDAIEADFHTTDRRRVQLVRVWMSSSPDPPCWWLLAQALEQVEYGALAQRIRRQHSKYTIQHI